jgi:FMN-dependent NADH-azoreductase
MNILHINSSARREASHSTRLANRIVQRLREADPDATLTERDLGLNPHPVLDEAALGALFLPRPRNARPSRPLASRSTMR